MNRRHFIQSSLLLSIGMAGCRSIESTFIQRNPFTNEIAGTSLDGYPITLKVPTHVRVTLYQNHFLTGTADSWQLIQVEGASGPLSAVSFSTQLVETEKIFTIDHKRPLAGQIQYGVNFTEDQYIDEFSEAATEDALRQSTIAMARTIDILQGGSPGARTDAQRTRTLKDAGLTFDSLYDSTAAPKPRLAPTEAFVGGFDPDTVPGDPVSSVLATDLFEIEDPEFDLKVASFLQCHTCNQ